MKLTLIHVFGSALTYRIVKRRVPVVVSMSITSRCNLKCTYCYSQHDNNKGHDVPLEKIKSRIDEFYAMGTRILMLQGGEPLLHRNLAEIIEYVKKRGMYCSVTTNGIGFEKYVKALKNCDQIQLSIDGNMEITDKFRGPGVYNAIMVASELCHKNTIPFHLHIVISKESTVENVLLPLMDVAKKYDTYLNFCIPSPTGAAKGKDLVDNGHIQNFYREIYKFKKRGELRTNNSNIGIKAIINWGNNHSYSAYLQRSDREAMKSYERCVMGNLVCWVDSNGFIHPCASQYGEPGFSYSIEEYGVKGAWEKLSGISCHYCPFSTEFNNLFNLRLESVITGLKFIKNRIR
ncbi:MAG: radical SAM protein [Oligoflexales bacterium]|nr:radical SAM protein [Oligoflexales bacterium]